MKLRIVYSKLNEAKYLSHLDMLKLFEKAFRRAKLDIEYSKGYSPRPIIVFAHPLSVGIESIGEIVEFNLNTGFEDIELIKDKINKALIKSVRVLHIEKITEKEKNIMSRVYSAKYEIKFEKDYEKLDEFFNQKQIFVEKKTKKGNKTIDIKSLIRNYTIDNGVLIISIDTGSKSNLKPNLIVKAFGNYLHYNITANVKRLFVEF